MNKNIIIVLVIGLILLGAAWFFMSTAEAPAITTLPPDTVPLSTERMYQFATVSGEVGTISYPNENATIAALTIDGETYILQRSETETDTQYTNEDGSVVYQEVNGIVTVQLGEVMVVNQAPVIEITPTLPTVSDDTNNSSGAMPLDFSEVTLATDASGVLTEGSAYDFAGGTITFAEERYQLSFGCNTITGEYELEDGQLVLKDAVSTKMACPDETVMALETNFVSEISAGRVYIKLMEVRGEMTGDELLQSN